MLSDYIDLSNFSEDELDFGRQNGKLNAIPMALNTQTIYDSYGLEIPATWDDFFEAAQLMKGEVYPIAMASKALWFFAIAYAEQQTGRQFMTMDGSVNFAEDDIKVMIDAFRNACNAVIYERSTAEEQARTLYDVFHGV